MNENEELKKQLNNKNLFKEVKRGNSADKGKVIFVEWVLNNVNKNEKILDIGFGSGAYGKLLKTFWYTSVFLYYFLSLHKDTQH
jgi:hypothetical protein